MTSTVANRNLINGMGMRAGQRYLINAKQQWRKAKSTLLHERIQSQTQDCYLQTQDTGPSYVCECVCTLDIWALKAPEDMSETLTIWSPVEFSNQIRESWYLIFTYQSSDHLSSLIPYNITPKLLATFINRSISIIHLLEIH